MPPWASGPVFTVSRPSLNGAAWAWTAGALSAATLAPVASMPLRTDRRFIDIVVTPWVVLWRPLWRAACWLLRSLSRPSGLPPPEMTAGSATFGRRTVTHDGRRGVAPQCDQMPRYFDLISSLAHSAS